ncbi:hypothetical protein SAMN05428962_1822 [Paenibacillus sp. BC26]|nr:hypothetical protein SAMN05428962_1822 [Paenibacillus sp. BC26]
MISISGLIASIGCILLCCVFSFWNPYSTIPIGIDTLLIMSITLVLPALLGIVSSLRNNRLLMYMVFVWSLPFGLYMCIASIPSVWNLYGVVLILYLIAAIRMNRSGYSQTIG